MNSTLETLKNMPVKSDYQWTLKTDVKNTVAEYKSYLNGGITEEDFDRKVHKLLYTHLKKNHELDSEETISFSHEELAMMGMEIQEFRIFIQTVQNILNGFVEIKVRDDKDELILVFTPKK